MNEKPETDNRIQKRKRTRLDIRSGSAKNPLLAGRALNHRIVFSAVIIAGFFIWAAVLIQKPHGLQNRAFYSNSEDWFMDFYNTVYYSVGKTPYTWGWLPARNYLPIAYMLVYPFSFLYPYDISDWGTAGTSRYSQLPAIGGFMFMLFSILLVLIPLKRLMKGRESEKIGILAALLMSSVMLFNYDRANQIVMVMGLLLIYYISLDSDSLLFRQFGLFCLSLATALKIFPAFFGVLLFQKKRYRDMITAVIYTVLLAVLPFFWLNGGFTENIHAYLNALNEHAQVYANGSIGLSADLLFGKHLPIPELVSYLLAIVSALLSCMQEEEWKRLLQISLAFMLCSGQQNFYCMIVIFLPLVLLLNKEEFTLFDWVYLLGFIGILLPAQYHFFGEAISNETVINTICVLGFFYLTGKSLVKSILLLRSKAGAVSRC